MLALYPNTWRTRYEEEMLALLEQHPPTLLTLLDMLRGAFEAWIDPFFQSLPTPKERGFHFRQAYNTVFIAFPLLIGGYLFFLDSLDDTLYFWNKAHPTILLWKETANLLTAGGFVAFLLSALLRLIQKVRQDSEKDSLLRLLFLPIVMLLGMLAQSLYIVVWSCLVWHLSTSEVQGWAEAMHRDLFPGSLWHLHLLGGVCCMLTLTLWCCGRLARAFHFSLKTPKASPQ